MKDKLLEIINHYGVLNQLKYFQSEVFELNEAIIDQQYVELYGGSFIKKRSKEHIAEEIADVLVMLKQFQLYYGIESDQVKIIMEQKVDRQLDRIAKEK